MVIDELDRPLEAPGRAGAAWGVLPARGGEAGKVALLRRRLTSPFA